jgi:hypothetical protein
MHDSPLAAELFVRLVRSDGISALPDAPLRSSRPGRSRLPRSKARRTRNAIASSEEAASW